jgi:hypothetical protein
MTHRVSDYDAWKVVYDEDAPRRQEGGLSEGGHFHSSDDRNSFLIVWDMDTDVSGATAAAGGGMLADPDLAQLMQDNGVLDKPEFWVA